MRSSCTTAIFLFVLFTFNGCSRDVVSNREPAAATPTPAPAIRSDGSRAPVLVELFTSEGCGNCPPADAELALLDTTQPIQGADIIALGFHVDYFNDRGWKDEFSSKIYTDRQNQYGKLWKLDSVYTPQMVVDGEKQFVGSDSRQAAEVIARAAAPDKATVDVALNDKRVEVNVQGISKHEASTVYLAATEDNLISKVTGGANNGKTLKHVSVVRGFAPIAKLTATQSGMKTSVDITPDPTWKKENTRYVVFVQEDQNGRVIAAGRTKK